MEGIKRTLAVSILSRGWGAVLGLLAVPWYVGHLGVEAYGVVGLFTSFSILVAFLDLGLGATLIRELAKLFGSREGMRHCRDMTRTFELTYLAIAFSICILGLGFSGPVAQHWIQIHEINRDEAAQALALASIALACQWPANLYSSGLTGIHRQTQLGVASMLFATLRLGLTFLAIWWKPNLEFFFYSQIVSALLLTCGLRWLLWHGLAFPNHTPVARMTIIQSSLKFAGGMTGITITSIILTQTDKVILSNALTLSSFGLYVIAGTLATGLYILISPMFSVVYPRFCRLLQDCDVDKLAELYHVSSQTLALMIMPVAAIFAVFSREILYIWTGDVSLAEKGSLILALLIIGNACNGIMNMPYALQLAFGWTKLAFWVNVTAIIILVPTIWWAAKNHGATGAASVWMILNLGYIIFTPQIMHSRLLLCEKKAWYWNDVLLPALTCIVMMVIFRQINFAILSRISTALILLCVWLVTSLVVAFSLFKLRVRIVAWMRVHLVRKMC